MKKNILPLVFSILSVSVVVGQSPYALTPEWRFGAEGGLSFPSGSFPTSGAPIATPASSNPTAGVYPEASTSISSRSGAVAIYSNTISAFNVSNASIRSFSADGVCAGSATGGGVIIPDPSDPDNAYYMILSNDLTWGSCGSQGFNRYRFVKSAGVATYNSGSTNMAANNAVAEGIAAGTDGRGGYWIVGHVYTASNTFRVWNVSGTGVITGPVDYTVGAATPNVDGNQSYVKISPCQDKVAFTGGGTLVVHNFNRNTGVVGAELRRLTGVGHGVGLEFSPDGSKIYYSGQGTGVSWVDIASGTTGTVAGSASWSMQLGPDGKIYTSPGGSSLVGVISSPNSAPSYSTMATNGYIYRGLSNIAWLSPQSPVVTATGTATCNRYNFSFVFQNYFNNNIGVNVPTVTWDWGDGSPNTTNNIAPTHDFPTTGGPYTVTLTFNDATCGHTWTDDVQVTISCPAPVELISFTGQGTASGVDLLWKTASELNNDFFEVQRSYDGKHFSSIGEVKGAGTSRAMNTYPFHDGEVTSGVAYYRLVQHDVDGTLNYTKTIAVRFSGSLAAAVQIAPNPFSDSFVLSKMYSEAATVSVYDIYGRLLEQKATSAEDATVTLGEELANGSYIVQYATGSGSYTFHVEKK